MNPAPRDPEADEIPPLEIPTLDEGPTGLFGIGKGGADGSQKMVEYAPGKFAAAFACGVVPRYGIVRMEHVGKNEYRPRLVGWGKMIALRRYFRPGVHGGEPHPLMQSLGLDLSYNSVLRLWKNGFIRGSQPVPNRILIDIESLNRHLQEASDPDFWTEDRVKRFRETIY